MTPKKTKRASYSTSIEAAESTVSPRKDARISGGLLLRAALGLMLMVGSAMAFSHSYTLARAAVEGKRGFERAANQPGAYLAGVGELRRALREDPENPLYNIWLANLLFQRESERARQGSLQSIEADRFHEALALLRRAEKTVRNPSAPVMLMGDAANMLATYYERLGNSEQELRFSKVAAENYLIFRDYASHPPERRAAGYYERAIGRTVHTGWPFKALALYDSFRLHFPHLVSSQGTILDMVESSYSQMGEFPMMMALISMRVFDNPEDIRLLGKVQRAADENGQVHHALRIFEMLERDGNLPSRARPVLEQLRLQHASLINS